MPRSRQTQTSPAHVIRPLSRRVFKESELVSGTVRGVDKTWTPLLDPLLDPSIFTVKKKLKLYTIGVLHATASFASWFSLIQCSARKVFSSTLCISKFSFSIPGKLVAEYVVHLVQIKMRKEKKKEEPERERMERLNREYNGMDWFGLYNSDKPVVLDGGRAIVVVFQYNHKITFKGKVAKIKAPIGSLLYNSLMECQQLQQPPLRNVQQQVTSAPFEVETDWKCDVVAELSVQAPVPQVRTHHRKLILYQNPAARKLSPSKYGQNLARSREINS